MSALYGKIIDLLTKQGLLENMEYNSMIIYFLLASVFVTLIFSTLTSKYRAIKYFPGLLLTVVSSIMFYFELTQILYREHIIELFKWGLFIATGLISMLTALMVGVYTKSVKVRRKKRTAKKIV